MAWTKTGNLKGPKGDKGDTGADSTVPGPQGEQGIQGVPGPKGDTGTAGAQGPKGDTGATGLMGPEGPMGMTGAKGDKGDVGATGPQGLQGIQGEPGPKGDQGLQGIQGPAGETGPQGIQGLPGTDGAQGPEGPQGIQGVPGETGPQGIQGLPGADGAGIPNGGLTGQALIKASDLDLDTVWGNVASGGGSGGGSDIVATAVSTETVSTPATRVVYNLPELTFDALGEGTYEVIGVLNLQFTSSQFRTFNVGWSFSGSGVRIHSNTEFVTGSVAGTTGGTVTSARFYQEFQHWVVVPPAGQTAPATVLLYPGSGSAGARITADTLPGSFIAVRRVMGNA